MCYILGLIWESQSESNEEIFRFFVFWHSRTTVYRRYSQIYKYLKNNQQQYIEQLFIIEKNCEKLKLFIWIKVTHTKKY